MQAQRQADDLERSLHITKMGREQELARRIRSLASAEQGGHVIPLQTTPFEYPDGRVRLGGLCLQQGGGGWAR